MLQKKSNEPNTLMLHYHVHHIKGTSQQANAPFLNFFLLLDILPEA